MKNFKSYIQRCIDESIEFNQYGREHFGYNFDKTKEAAGNDKPSSFSGLYKDDYDGISWKYVKKRDDYTLNLAFIDGWCDNPRNKETHEDYMALKTKEDVQEFMIRRRDLRDKFDRALRFLKKHFKSSRHEPLQGRGMKVYRGYKWDKTEWDDACKAFGKVPKTGRELMDLVDNTTKEFNSFSSSRDVAAAMFANKSVNPRVTLLISGIAEPHDIYYAFTMYLMGRHGSDVEQELNIGNAKKLRDLKVELYDNPFN